MDARQSNTQAPTAGSAAVDSDPVSASGAGEDVLDEQQIEDALEILKEMHIQVSTTVV